MPFLPEDIRGKIPDGVDTVWEYSYDLAWVSGSSVPYFQVETNGAQIFGGIGSNGLDDWIFTLPGMGDKYLSFLADKNYLGEETPGGTLQFYTSTAPGKGWLVYPGEAIRGLAPAPEPATVGLMLSGLLGLGLCRRRKK